MFLENIGIAFVGVQTQVLWLTNPALFLIMLKS